MTLSYSQAKIVYQGDGETTRWEIPFPYLQTQDLQIVRVAQDGTETVLDGGFSIDTDLNIVCYPVSDSQLLPLAQGEKLLIRRRTPLTQQTDLQMQQAFDPAVLEAGYDKAMMIAQEQAEEISRAVRFPPSSALTQTDAGQYLRNLQQAAEQAAAANSAAQSALLASQTALEAAQQAEEAVQNYVSAAQDYAAQAQLKAEAAAESASDAGDYADNASDSAAEAAESAAEAEQNAAEAEEALADKADLDENGHIPYSQLPAEAQILLGVDFDGVHAQGVRTYGAIGKQWTKSTDSVAGVDDFKDNPIYQGYYALVKYNPALGRAEIVAREGTAEYEAMLASGTEDFDVVRMFHVFYYKKTVNADGSQSIVLSPVALEGFKPSPMHWRNGVLHEWIGITRYAWGKASAALGGMASRTGLVMQTAQTNEWFEERARARGMRIFGIKEASALQMLGTVKYAHLNWQAVLGDGCSLTARTEREVTVGQTEANSVIISKEYRDDFTQGYSFRIGNELYKIVSVEDYDTQNIRINTDTAISSTAGTKVSGALALNGTADAVKGEDGENASMHTITTRRAIIAMGIENLYGNGWKKLSGIMRMGGYSYINPAPDEQYACPTQTDTKGWEKGPAVMTTTGYIKRFADNEALGKHGYLSIPVELGGNADNPVGDYQYSTADSVPRLCTFGGSMENGAGDGAYYLDWNSAVNAVRWNSGALGVFVPMSVQEEIRGLKTALAALETNGAAMAQTNALASEASAGVAQAEVQGNDGGNI